MKRFLRILFLFLCLAAAGIALLFVSHKSLYRHADAGAHSLKVLSYNTQRMGGFAKPEKNSVIGYLRSSDADILCLQEVEVYKSHKYLTFKELRKALKEYPYFFCDFKIDNKRRQYGNVVFSKYPLANTGTVGFDSRGNMSSRCDVILRSDTIRLFVNHLESNRLEQNDIDSVIQTRSLSHGRLMDKLQSAGRLRRSQAREVRRCVKSSPYPVIVLGDFNDIPLSATYLTLRMGLKDCFLRTSNLRFGNTLVWHRFGMRIDYILCSPSFVPVAFRTDRTSGSDHYPVVATLTW